MNLRVQLISTVILSAMTVFAQEPVQTTYFANLQPATNPDGILNLSNTGAGGNANINVNVYAHSPDEQLISCCCCPLTVHQLVSLLARADLATNTLTPAVPSSITVKLVATQGGACNAAAPGTLSRGMAAWALNW